MDIQKCGNCRHWQVTTKCEGKGECRRHAPRLIVAGCGVGEVPEYQKDWALTLNIECCGEWEKRNEQVPNDRL